MTSNKVKVVYVKDYLEVFKMECKEKRYGGINSVKANGLISFLKELDPNSTLTFKVRT